MAFLLILGLAVGIFTALTLVLVGLVEMPWPVLLVGLIAVIYGFQRLTAAQNQAWEDNNSASTVASSQTPKAATNPPVSQTIYRGIKTNTGAVAQQPSVMGSSPTEPAAASDLPAQARDAKTSPKVSEIVYRGVRSKPAPSPQEPSSVMKGPDQGMVYRGIHYGDRASSPAQDDHPNSKS
ncbi:MAG: hypothetical protein VKO01_04975 [Cyanobacteriota bacterium]|jgi:hypothetical protein|nr:hypothetical protein [Cyanobacteriota bacterium]